MTSFTVRISVKCVPEFFFGTTDLTTTFIIIHIMTNVIYHGAGTCVSSLNSRGTSIYSGNFANCIIFAIFEAVSQGIQIST